jgi:hypothetical protein
MNSTPRIIVMVGGGKTLSEELLKIIHSGFGNDVVILTPEEAVIEGLCSLELLIRDGEVFIPPPKPEVFEIRAMPHFEYPIIVKGKSHEQKPWYAQFDKKKRRKH